MSYSYLGVRAKNKERKMTNRVKKSIFSILIRQGNENLRHLGTGFFIGKNGLFFTVGHTFRKIEDEITNNGLKNIFIAFPTDKSKIYGIVSLWYESKEIYRQKGPTYKDTAVGIVNHRNPEYLVFNRKRPQLNETLTAYGYHNTKADKLHSINNEIADLSMIVFGATSINVSAYEPIISDLPKDYQTPKDSVNKSRIFNNCVTLDKRFVKGESGSPLIDSLGLVSGILIGSSKLIETSDIILSKYCTKVIKYRTTYKHDTYQDLQLRL